jgi:putative two-component system response regulator
MLDISQCTVLVVDDNKNNIEIVINSLDGICDVSAALDGSSALKLVTESPPDLILLDIMMPGMDGFEVCRKLKSSTPFASIPVMFMTGMAEIQYKSKGFACGAVDYIVKPFDPAEVIARVKTHLYLSIARKELKNQNELLEQKVTGRTKELVLTQDVTIETLAALVEYRDPETGGHIQRTKLFVRALAMVLKNHPVYKEYLSDNAIELIAKSAPLHDVGKVGIPDGILLKPGKLSIEEFNEMKRHTTIGYLTLSQAEKKLGHNSFLTYAKDIAHSHHEKWDGSGYPLGLNGEQIPVAARLMALADVYDALISKRVYKPPFSHRTAVEIIHDSRGGHFDPLMVDAFDEIKEQLRNVALYFADFDEERATLSEI